MKKNLCLFLLLLPLGLSGQVVVDFSTEVGRIKPMNAVNNGPQIAGNDQKRGNFEAYKAAEFPFARLHDAPARHAWAHTVDISCIFPDFDADENKPESYDFTLTDKLIGEIHSAGTKVFYRLGQTIEHWAKKYEVFPPKDYRKWAGICEHIIRHYNEGWADGYHYNIEYWEIWNEADQGFKSKRYLKNQSPTWNGSDEDYFRFYEVASKHLKKCFPHLKFGGPALCSNNEWAENFLTYAKAHKVPLDFFSYHLYAGTAEAFVKKNTLIKSLLDKYGYSDAEMILNEWNYLANWTDEFVYTLEVISSYKGAAFAAAVMQTCQDGPVDMLMYYDARPGTSFNGLFNSYTSATMPAYYAMYSWKKLRALGRQVKAGTGNLQDVYVTSAVGDNGASATLITYYTDNKEKIAPIPLEIEFRNLAFSQATAHVTDKYKLHTETQVDIQNGKTRIFMEANSYILIETSL